MSTTHSAYSRNQTYSPVLTKIVRSARFRITVAHDVTRLKGVLNNNGASCLLLHILCGKFTADYAIIEHNAVQYSYKVIKIVFLRFNNKIYVIIKCIVFGNIIAKYNTFYMYKV